MDVYLGYNQISIHESNEKHITFMIDQGLYYYKLMSYGLKNAGAKYQRLVNKISVNQLGKQ